MESSRMQRLRSGGAEGARVPGVWGLRRLVPWLLMVLGAEPLSSSAPQLLCPKLPTLNSRSQPLSPSASRLLSPKLPTLSSSVSRPLSPLAQAPLPLNLEAFKLQHPLGAEGLRVEGFSLDGPLGAEGLGSEDLGDEGLKDQSVEVTSSEVLEGEQDVGSGSQEAGGLSVRQGERLEMLEASEPGNRRNWTSQGVGKHGVEVPGGQEAEGLRLQHLNASRPSRSHGVDMLWSPVSEGAGSSGSEGPRKSGSSGSLGSESAETSGSEGFQSQKANEERGRRTKRPRAQGCEGSGCATHPTFGRGEAQRPLTCAKHRKPADVDNFGKHKRCSFQGCQVQASYGNVTEGIPLFCTLHKRDSDLHIYSKLCQHSNCSRWASFGKPGDRRPQACSQHKDPLHVDLRNRFNRCRFDGCHRQSSFGDPLKGTLLFCSLHKLEGHVNVKNRALICKHPDGCSKRASYGDPTDGKPTYCRTHRSDGHINLRCGVCSHPQCKRQAPHVVLDNLIKNGRILRFCTLHNAQYSDPGSSNQPSSACKKKNGAKASNTRQKKGKSEVECTVTAEVQRLNRLADQSNVKLRVK